ncbi:hypothetical protein AVEN_123607-1 [Araneus ventricosus]|uniref:Uncharacterized protein n=1 Tax=Araneus ventricosus TaxID=182803 RepID=A0A4Y2IW30_ARAVE|nr:hypothetical protein AVEN_123607-1 [Araneus ventricosus]
MRLISVSPKWYPQQQYTDTGLYFLLHIAPIWQVTRWRKHPQYGFEVLQLVEGSHTLAVLMYHHRKSPMGSGQVNVEAILRNHHTDDLLLECVRMQWRFPHRC